MRDTDEVNALLQQVAPRTRGARREVQSTTTTESFLTSEEITRLAEQSSTEQAIDLSIEEPPQETIEGLQELVEQYVQINAEDSAEDVQLPEEEEKQYDSIIVRDETARFSSAEWFTKAQSFNITLAGIGGIGGWTALLLARLKPRNLSMYDPDTVELVNLAGQLYGVRDVGKQKVYAVNDYLMNNANYYRSCTYTSTFSRGSTPTPVMICGFDNMAARSEFFNAWKRLVHVSECRDEMLFIDGRLTATEFQVFCMTGEDTALMERYYREYIFPDEEASQEICSFKQTAYLANMIAGVIVNLYINFCANLCGSPFKKALPFLTKYNTDMMMFNTEY